MLLFLGVCSAVPAEGESERLQSGEYEYVLLKDGTAEIVGYSGEAATVKIPSNLNGKTVTSIGEYAFAAKTDIKKLMLPDSVLQIKEGAFSGCAKLASITFSKKLAAIEEGAFGACNKLKEISLPEGLKSIGPHAFAYCENLTSITVPQSAKSVSGNFTVGCKRLTNIRIPQNHPTLSMIDNVLFNKKGTILYCYPAGRKDKTYTIPNGTVIIGDQAFSFCESLTEVILPESITDIEYGAFFSSALASIVLPSRLSFLGDGAFYGCKRLTHINIPSKLSKLGSNAFGACSSLVSIQVQANHPTFSVKGDGVLDKKGTRLVLYLPGTQNKTYNVPAGTKTIQEYAFCNPYLETVTLPTTLTDIGDNAFNECSSLKKINIFKNVKSIEKNAFDGCDNLTAVVTKGSYAETYCKQQGIPYKYAK